MNLSRSYISISFSNQRQLFGNWQLLLFNQSTVWAGLPTIYYPYPLTPIPYPISTLTAHPNFNMLPISSNANPQPLPNPNSSNPSLSVWFCIEEF